MRLFTLAQIAKLLNQHIESSPALIQGFCVDTRHLKPGEIFFALKGEHVDGHDYLLEAQKKGAAAAVVSKAYAGPCNNLFMLRVEDPLQALQELAKQVLSNTPCRIAAITGSIGKTTTKEFANCLLSGKYRTAASPGNSNSQIGLPLAILNHTNGKEEILILEMGMTEPGNLLQLIQIAPPEVAVLTSVALVHACNFNSIEEIAWTKSEIFQHPHTRLGIMHREIPGYDQITCSSSCPKVSFSTTAPEAAYTLDPRNPKKLLADGQSITLDNFKLPGRHNLHNLLAAIALARHFNVGWDEIQQRIGHLQLPERRLQFLTHKDILFVNDSYNAAELSVKAALEALPQPMSRGRKIAVLGSMMELGKFSADSHRRVGEFALNCVDQIYCLGEECRPIYDLWTQSGKPVRLFHEFADLMDCLRQVLKPSDVVLIKGSRAKQMWRILDEL